MNGAGRHHDHGPVGQPELFLPARENVSNGRRKRGRRSILHVELGDGENVAHDTHGPFACEKGIKQSAGLAISSNRSSVPTRTSGADRFDGAPPIVFCPEYTGSRFRVDRTGRRRAGCAGWSGAAARPPEGAQSVESSS